MQDTPYGYCQCGCGQQTKIAARNDATCGWVKGEPMRFIRNHHRRTPLNEHYTVEDLGHETPCWTWQATIRDGYGRIHRDGRSLNAHRWYYEQEHGPIPEGLQLDHLCRNRACVNPSHLEPVTQTTNIQRGFASRPKKTHCKRGHEFTPENTIIGSDGARRCRKCDNAAQLRSYYKRKAKQATR